MLLSTLPGKYLPSSFSHVSEQILVYLFPIKCHHTATFPAVRSLQHPLVIAFFWGHPVSAQAVSREIPVPLLLRGHPHRSSVHTVIYLTIKYPWKFPSKEKLLLYLQLSAPLALGLSWSMKSCGRNPPSTSQTYDFPLLLLSPQPPHSLAEFGSALLFPPVFFFPSFSSSLYFFHSKWCLWAMKSGPVLVCNVWVCV